MMTVRTVLAGQRWQGGLFRIRIAEDLVLLDVMQYRFSAFDQEVQNVTLHF
jgi:hypothetical protein